MKSVFTAYAGAGALSFFTGRITDLVLFGAVTTFALFSDVGKSKT